MPDAARRVLIGLLATLTVLAAPSPAFAHGGTDRAGYSNYRARITSVAPVVAGLTVKLSM